jgi:DNA-binding NarL/FixJ family response regulator
MPADPGAAARPQLRPAAAPLVPPPAATQPAARASAPQGQDWRQLPRSEQRVIQLVVQGLTNRQIAEALFLSKHTVDSHLKSAFTKLGVRSRVELTVLVHQSSD